MADPVLLEQVRQVARARHQEALFKAAVDASRKEWEQANAATIQAHTIARITLDTAEDALRNSALEYVNETGDLKPAPGVSVRKKTTVELRDAEAAMAWAKQTGFCLSLDRKALDAIATKGGVALPFVSVVESRTITIATDLTKALAESEATV